MDIPRRNRALIAIGVAVAAADVVVIAGRLLHIPFFLNLLSDFAAINILCLVVIGFVLFIVQDRIIRAGFEATVKHHEDAAEKSEQRYQSLIEHTSDAIYVVDQQRNFIHVNDAMCKMTGYTSPELLKMNVIDVIDADELKNDPLSNPLPVQLLRERTFVHKNGIDTET